MELVVVSTASVAGGLRGDLYGKAVKDGIIPDTLMMKKWASPAVWGMIDRGIVVATTTQKHSCLPHGHAFVPFAGIGHCVYDRDCEDGAAATPLAPAAIARTPKLTFRYEVEVRDQWAVISGDHVPSFLLENGIAVLSPTQAVAAFQEHLVSSMDLQEARVLKEFRLTAPDSEHLTPGQATCFLKFARPFAEYTRDPQAFEATLKGNMLRALGLDPIAAPNMLNFIEVLSAKPGSIEIVALIVGGVLVAGTIVAAIRAGRAMKVRRAGAELEAHRIRYVNHLDGRYEIHADTGSSGWWCTVM